jgi:hypothetical protein
MDFRRHLESSLSVKIVAYLKEVAANPSAARSPDRCIMYMESIARLLKGPNGANWDRRGYPEGVFIAEI